jgi:hypothetical protein
MLEKYLPWLKNQQKKQQQQKEQENRQNPNNPLNEKPQDNPVNLIGTEDVYTDQDLAVFKLSNIFPFITLMVYMTFVLLYGYNLILDSQLSAKKNEQDRWVRAIRGYEKELEVGRELEEKIDLYKEVLASRTDFKLKLNTLIKLLPDNVEVEEIEAKETKFEIQLKGDNVLLFARLITLYLGSDEIDEMALSSAVLNKRDETYSVVFSGTFK